MPHNPNCDGNHCTKEKGEVRILPLGDEDNAIYCYDCYLFEIDWRKEKNTYKAIEYDIPSWESLKVYPIEE